MDALRAEAVGPKRSSTRHRLMKILKIHLVNPVEAALETRDVFRDGMMTLRILIGRALNWSTILVWQSPGDPA